GDDPASQVYVGGKIKACAEVGIESIEHKMPADSTQNEIGHVIANLNHNPNVHGILLQLPLPGHLNADALIQSIAPGKDVDGLTFVNQGKLAAGDETGLVPCTPQGALHLVKSVK